MRIARLVLIVTTLLTVPSALFAQAGAVGKILGTVTDSTGAVIPGAQVTVTNTATGVAFKTRTSSAGDYLAPSLQPGTYSVTATAKGFQKSVTTGFSLSVDQSIRVNLTLQAGEVTSTVTVSAQAVALDTDSEALSQLVGTRQVSQLPLNGRNFMQLLLVTPGAVTVGGEQGTMRQGEGNAVSINGGRPEGNNYTLDGLDNTDPALVTPAVILSQDAIQEFKVQGGDYSAEYGYSAAQVNIVSKGGTNQFHGSIFETNRNNAYDAKPFPTASDYQAGVATALPVLHQNQFGFVLDGPVWIPKVYNGHNKTFFMANYEGWRVNNGGRAALTLPTPAVLGGDFSAETYPANTIQRADKTYLPGGPLPAYGTPDCTVLLDNGYNCMPVDPTTGKPFPGNKIPAADFTNRLGLVAVKYNYWAKPNVSGQIPEGQHNFFQNYAAPLTTNQQTYRIDQHMGKLGSVFFRYTKSDYVNHTLRQGTLNYGMAEYIENQKSWTVSHTMSLGNSAVNNFRFGYLDAYAPQGAPAPPSDAVQALAMKGVFTTFTALQETWPSLGMSTYSTTGGPGNAYTGSDSPAWEFADDFTWVHGRQTFGFGFDYRTWRLDRNLDDDFYGDWGFSSSTILNNSTNCPNAAVTVGNTTSSLCGTGNAVADMMLGYYSGVSGFVPGPLSPTDTAGNPQIHQFGYFGPYFYDNMKLTSKLTMNLGLRWDYRMAAYEIHNHFFWLDTTNKRGGLCYADPQLTKNGVAPGGDATSGPILKYCGKYPHPGQKTVFAPRFGLAYRLTNKTVLRGGYGIFFDSYEGREIDDSADIYPYSIRNSLNPTSDSSLAKFGNDMFPVYSTLGPFPASTLSFIAVIESQNPIRPYVQSWNVSFQRQLSSNTTLEVNYIGTHALHLLDRHNIAQPYPIQQSDLAYCQQTDSSGNYINLDNAPCTRASRLPYPNFTNFYINSDFNGYSHYNAMNMKFTHDTSNLATTIIYTYANSKDDKSAAAGVGATGSGYQGFMNNHDPSLDYGPSDFNVPQRFVASYIYQLPFGRGQKFLGGANRAANLAVGGWQVTGITTFQSGFPFSITASDIGGVLNTQFQRANYKPGCNIKSGLTKKLQRINMACFTQPALGTFGDTKRNFLRQPGINNWDMGFGKTFDIAERLKFKINVDTFNTFNHHQYDIATNGLIAGGSGGGSAVSNGVASSTAGQITGSGPSRIIQLAGKITF